MSRPSQPSAERYRRQISLPEVGPEGQRRLAEASVLMVGAGGIGSPASLYLAAAGVGRIGIVEHDRVDATNLHRQVLYATDDTGRPKLDAAVERLSGLNPEIRIEPHARRFDETCAAELVRGYDLVLDGSDNFPTRYLVNDVCVRAGVPDVYGSVFRFEGQASVFGAPDGPCYRCLFPDPPSPADVPNCAEGGVLGVLPGIVGLVQATEALKWILDRGESLVGRLLLVDALDMSFRTLRVRRDPACPTCGDHPRSAAPAVEACAGGPPFDIEVEDLERRRAAGDMPRLLDVRTEGERAICVLPESAWIPVQELEGRIEELPRDEEIVVYCHSGVRSRWATERLRAAGFTRARNLAGGIDAWALRVDREMPRY